MKIKNKKFPKDFGGALKNSLLDASGEKFFEWAWDLFEEMPEVKETLKSNEQEVYSKINDPHLQNGIEQTIGDIRVNAEQFYLALGFLVGQKYAVHSSEIRRDLGYLEMRMVGGGVLPLSTPIAPK